MTSYSLVTVTPEDRPRGDRYLCDYFPENLEVSGYSSQVFQLESFFVRFSAWRRSLSRCAGCCSLDHSDQRFVDYCLSPDTALYSQSSRTRRGVLGTLVWVRDQTWPKTYPLGLGPQSPVAALIGCSVSLLSYFSCYYPL